jgi:ribosomal protein S18 acetylase RimI-like enzyme
MSSTSSELTLHISPSPSAFFRQTAIIHCTAFANSPLSQWWATTPADAATDTADKIPPFRLYRTMREHAHRELKPGTMVVCALIDGQVVGYADWGLPRKLWRSETLAEFVYRKGMEYRDALEDWLVPPWWYSHKRRVEFEEARVECIEKYLGPGKIDEIWYLKILAVHPGFQRKRVGAALLDWGLRHAQERGQKVYLESSPSGEGLYLRKGFKDVGKLIVGEEGEPVVMPCMIWDPRTPPNQDEIAQQAGKIEKQA